MPRKMSQPMSEKAEEALRARIARNLEAAREAAGFSQAELARRTGMSRPHVIITEAGRCAPNIISLVKTCRALGIELDQIVGADR